MKKWINLAVIITFISSLSFSVLNGQNSYNVLLDSTYSFIWNNETQQWGFSGKDIYEYDDVNKLVEWNKFNEKNGILSEETRFYTDTSMIRILKIPVEGSMINWRKYYTHYNDIQQMDIFETFTWSNGDWARADKNFCTYDGIYIVKIIRQYLFNGLFQDVERTDYIWEKSRLIENRLSNIITNNPISRTLYLINSKGQRAEGLLQTWVSGTWINTSKDTYSYNNCGTLLEIASQNFSGELLSNARKTQYFYFPHFVNSDEKKIAVCHNGHTIYISKNALKAHLVHGDCIGECTVEEKPRYRHGYNDQNKHEKPPFICYPNPAREKITIKFDKDECKNSRVELTDFYGKLIKVFNIKDNSDLVIYRNNLHSGKYYIRFSGKDVYSEVVIFQ